MTIEYDKDFSSNRCLNEIADIKKDIESLMEAIIYINDRIDKSKINKSSGWFPINWH